MNDIDKIVSDIVELTGDKTLKKIGDLDRLISSYINNNNLTSKQVLESINYEIDVYDYINKVLNTKYITVCEPC